MRPPRPDIAVPPFRPGTTWIREPPPAVEKLCARGPLLVHFFCPADLNSVRTLTYVRAWADRYAALGLSVLGVVSPRFEFMGDPAKLAAALDRQQVGFPVAADRDYRAWRDYGCRGWPSLFLWRQGGALHWFHFGEGEYTATEEEIQALLREGDALVELPAPLEPARPSDAPGARVMPPSEEVFPGGAIESPWRPSGEPVRVEYEAGGAAATVDGRGELLVSVDGLEAEAIVVPGAGLYELAFHPRHERHRLELDGTGGVRVHSISFAPGVP